MDNSKDAIVRQMTDLEFIPETLDFKEATGNCQKIPVQELYALGSGIRTAFVMIKNMVDSNPAGAGGLYRVTVPKGTTLHRFTGEASFFGGAFDVNNNLVGQARMTPVKDPRFVVHCDPYMIIMASALMSINKKLDAIEETQREILAFLEQKERAELTGNLNFLSDIVNNYKYNWENEQYKNHNHIKVLDIKQEAEKSIALFRSRINGMFNKRGFVYLNRDVNKKLNNLYSCFGDYQFAVYLYAFSSYVEVLLLGNFEQNYIARVKDKIEKYSLDYREMYSGNAERLDSFSKNSVESFAMRGLAEASKFMGETVKKIPVVNETRLDKSLFNAGGFFRNAEGQNNKRNTERFVVRKQVDVDPFVENLTTISRLYNEPVIMYADSENVYFRQ